MAYTEWSAEDDGLEEDRVTASLGGLAVVLAVLVLALFLVYHLRDKARLEDCLLAGRQDCMPVLAEDAL